MSTNKLKLIKLSKKWNFVFHGSPKKISILKPKQGYDEWKKDWKPAVFATQIIDIAIFRSLINKYRWDIVGTSKSEFWIKENNLYFRSTKNLLEAAINQVWYVHVLDASKFKKRDKIQYIAYEKVIPIQIMQVYPTDLPSNIEILTPPLPK